MTNKVELLRKLSAKTIIGKIDPPEDAVDLFTIYGSATDVKSGESAYGQWDCLVGKFEAVKMDTGEMFASMQCFLPEPMGSMLVNRVRELEDGEKVEFAVVIGVKPCDRGSTGYEYTCKPVVEPEATSELSALRDLVRASVPMLPAPLVDEKVKAPEAKTKSKK